MKNINGSLLYKRISCLCLVLVFAAFCLEAILPSSIYAASRGISVEALTLDGSTKNIQLYSGYYALIIGCSDYGRGWSNLPNPVKDAREVAEMLKKIGWKVDILENPKGAQLRRSLNKIIVGQGRDRDKAILIWFSGHGHTLKEVGNTKLGYLVPVDAPDPYRYELEFMEKAVSMREIETVARRINARHVIMLFDSCFSGAIFQAVRSGPTPYLEEKIKKPVRQFITAGADDEQVPDRSVFKTVFLQGIKECYADRNKDGYVTGLEIGDYLQEKVVNYSRGAQHPQFGKINDPRLDKGDFVFHLASSSALVEKPATTKNRVFLNIRSNVSGAKIFIDNIEAGRTPAADMVVSPGERRIYVEKQGYEPYQKTIRFESGRSITLYADLNKEKLKDGRLFVETSPENARIRILNISPKFYQGIKLKSGRYNVEVSAKGHETDKRWIALSADEDKYVDIRLKEQKVEEETSFTNSIGMKFVYIQPGMFIMGSPSSEEGRDSDENQHKVTLTKGYYMQTTEVTQGQWREIIGNNPSYYKNCGDNCPVESVSWNDAQEFIRKLNQKEGTNNYRLPTEAEWEYACRAGSETAIYTGGLNIYGANNAPALDDIAWYGGNSCVNYSGGYDCSAWKEKQYSCSKCGTHPVAQKKPNAWRLYDMIGNVWEWCQDWKGGYPAGHVTDPKGPSSGLGRVVHGGCWSFGAKGCRSADRGYSSPGSRSSHLGFRLSRNL